MLRTARTKKFSSSKIYDLLIGLGADEKKTELAIGEFVKDIPKILTFNEKKTGLDATAPVSKVDIWRLESTISENHTNLVLKIKGIESKMVENKNDLEAKITKSKNDLEAKLAEIKSDLESKIKDIERKIVESKNVLLQWILGMVTGYTILLIVVLRFFEK